jgi:hypothetical protein
MARGKIFINYRRDDSRADAGRLYDRLVLRFPGKVFRDVTSLEPGVEWHEAIARVLAEADACIVVIGKDWLKISDASGRRRLDDPRDTVRQELMMALSRKMRVFPVLVGGAKMPQEEELPADLQSLCRRNALEITEQDWDEGFNKLSAVLASSLGLRAKGQEGEGRSSRRTWVFAGIGSLAAVILAVYAASNSASSSRSGGPPVVTPDSAAPPRQVAERESSNGAVAPSQLVGTWKADVVELGVPTEIVWQIRADGNSTYVFSSASGRGTASTTWTYADGVIYEESSIGSPSKGSIHWIDRNHFVLTIIDNGLLGTSGLERHYSRM